MTYGGVDGAEGVVASAADRGVLDQLSIVEAAIEVLEEQGVAKFTVAAVARLLAAPVTSVHWHFRTKADLLNAVAEQVTLDFYNALPPVALERAWDVELQTYFKAMRQQLLKNRSFIDLSLDRGGYLLSRPRVRQTINVRLEAELAALVRVGVSPDDAYRLYNTGSNYVRGFVVLELAHVGQIHEAEDIETQLLDPQKFPLMSQIPDLGALSWRDADHQFDLGLKLLLIGMREQIQTEV
ncbi:MAG: TetR/AcrR family transcriptional regulator C-terminal domain-containing protein [Actinomycetota bacterium]|nr:TetR/AcrR family transcriptional regulator C-terminal domain-containing protein [Actinomycetota bacterium]